MSKKKKSKASNAFLRTHLLEELLLYPFQREAVDKMREYISAFSNLDTKGSGLVNMPTGSGKTAVIAVLTRCIPDVKSSLILCSRTVLRDQLFKEIQGPVFQKLGLPLRRTVPGKIYCLADKKTCKEFEKKHPKNAKIVTTIQELLKMWPNDSDNAAIVTTIQMLLSVYKNEQKSFAKLIARIDLLVFDEGHHEPALRWSETIRQIKKPRIIFTATPFRNDLKSFDVDLKHAYTYSFGEAVSYRIIRDVNIIRVRSPQSPQDFVELVLKEYEHLRDIESLDNDSRVIIRCDDSAQIGQIAKILRSKKISYVAIHERFRDNSDDDTKWKTVPDPQKTEVLIWIHQHKLLEGVDEGRFQLLAIYGKGPGSVRAIVQQVGRIVRNPDKKKNSIGYVMDTFEGQIEHQWANYRERDEFIKENGLEDLDTKSVDLQHQQNAYPPTLYVDGCFRSRFSLKTTQPKVDIQLPLRTNVFYRKGHFNMLKVAEAIRQEFEEADRLVAKPDIGNRGCVILSIRFRNSRYLTRQFFMEPKLCVTLIRLVGRYICFFDSGNLNPDGLSGFGSPVAAVDLRRMLIGHSSSQIRRVSLVNSSIAPDSIQSISMATYSSIERTPLGFNPFAYICTTADGCIDADLQLNDPGIRRYVGFSNARLSQGSTSRYHSLAEYEQWLEAVAKILSQQDETDIPALVGFAEIHKPPDDPTPRSILLDVDAVRDRYRTIPVHPAPDEPIEIVQESVSVRKVGQHPRMRVRGPAPGKFKVIANGLECPVRITYDKSNRKYRLSSLKLDEMYYNVERAGKSIVRRLNAEQAFRVIPETRGVVYAAGEFYDPQIGLGEAYKDKHNLILDTIHPYSVFKSIKSEKGPKRSKEDLDANPEPRSGWPRDAFFGLIDRVGTRRLGRLQLSDHEKKLLPLFKNVELLVCDDMGTELADFIMVRSIAPNIKRVVLIHCKALAPKEKTQVSASAMADVCSQAIKNIGEVNPFRPPAVDRIHKWDQNWDGGSFGKVAPRIRKGPNNSEKAWDLFRAAVEDPNTEREVWLFLGNMLSKDKFQERLKVTRRNARSQETMQALYELLSTLSVIQSMNARFLVFCNQ